MKFSLKSVVRGQKLAAFPGFTLVELLIVIAVVGILATVLIIAVNPAKQLQKSRDTGRKAALKSLQNALEQYYSDNGSYPVTSCYSGSTGVGACWRVTSGAGAATDLLGLKAANYMKEMPADPKPTGTTCAGAGGATAYGYQYTGVAAGTSYTLVTRLENTSDSQVQAGPLGGCNNVFNYSIVNQQ